MSLEDEEQCRGDESYCDCFEFRVNRYNYVHHPLKGHFTA